MLPHIFFCYTSLSRFMILSVSPPLTTLPSKSLVPTPKSLVLILLILVLACVLVPAMTTTSKRGASHQACAACKYQRRRCTKDCKLAPYFPADQQHTFLNAHRLFGVSNIVKILKAVHPEQRDEAMTSVKFESDIRARFPVHGCLGIIQQLQCQLQQTAEELRHVLTQIAIYKNRQQNRSPSHSSYSSSSSVNNPYSSSPSVNDPLGFLINHHPQQQQQQHQYAVGIHASSTDDDHLLDMAINPHGYPIQQENIELSRDYGEIPFESYIESKEGGESSTQCDEDAVPENELKTAAARFSLLSVQ